MCTIVQDERTQLADSGQGVAPSGNVGVMVPPQGTSIRRIKAQERRKRLLEATFEIIGKEGIDAVSHRRVAELAGVPLGSTTYYFSSREQMLTEALDHCARVEIDKLGSELSSLSEAAGDRVELGRALTAFVMEQLGEDQWRTMGQYALLHEAARRPELRSIVGSWTESLCAVIEGALTDIGSSSPALDATMLLAMLDGILLGAMADPDTSRRRTRSAVSAQIDRFLTMVSQV